MTKLSYSLLSREVPFKQTATTCTVVLYRIIGLATKGLRILSLGGIDKIRNHLVANPIRTIICLP